MRFRSQGTNDAVEAGGQRLADAGATVEDFLLPEDFGLTWHAGRLAGLLDDSKRRGFPLKVAVIARRADLGAIPSLFGQPREYARFLGQEKVGRDLA